MIERLVVRNFVLIDHLEVEFGPGLNVLTGETGTGKSLLIDALEVVLGRRASPDYVRAGADRAYLEVVFGLQGGNPVLGELENAGMEAEEGLLILSRELFGNGRNVYRIGGRTVPLSIFREIGRHLVDFHGQGEQQSLLRESRHGELLDRVGGPELRSAVERLEHLFRDWAEARRVLEQYRHDAMERARRLDVLSLQVQEIDRAGLEPEEEESLREERGFLVNAEQIAHLAGESYQVLYGAEDHGPAAVVQIGRALENLRALSRICQEARDAVPILESVLNQVQETARDLLALRERARFDPGRLDRVEARLALIEGLKRKYGATLDDILRFRETAAAERDRLLGSEEEIAGLEKRIATLSAEWEALAAEVSAGRRKTAAALEEGVTLELRELEFANLEFRVDFQPLDGPNARGREQAVFLFSANPGEPLKSLARIASGGELSRIMLALKKLLAEVDETPTLIFDEVDAGVGGRAMQAVAEKLSAVGRKHQVICVTHAPQIACHANRHLQIGKETAGGTTRTVVRELDEEERLEELARMLAGGREITDAARKHAFEMRKSVTDSRSRGLRESDN
ncbi:DNA repair protein RecN [Candidatus Desulforudis audaxviator]|uniref:DNA repair protein RecN n=1 Tax=Desulforudis audaxviator (strain MP104C) TaxID=477974 RepID=B1I3K0_DESAP|nr:DNA repair protein RecN [Candidatus Desulforudis audaxviator]ACA59543.1 DNA repair protein RecN [Candidatus Desulforudis audaxviator MP104C]AZK59526.1 DNA repair protein RecN [Candidatus Desulforudis audaxviator]